MLIKAAEELHSHRDPVIPAGCWMNANESCCDSSLVDNSVCVTVSLEYVPTKPKGEKQQRHYLCWYKPVYVGCATFA